MHLITAKTRLGRKLVGRAAVKKANAWVRRKEKAKSSFKASFKRYRRKATKRLLQKPASDSRNTMLVAVQMDVDEDEGGREGQEEVRISDICQVVRLTNADFASLKIIQNNQKEERDSESEPQLPDVRAVRGEGCRLKPVVWSSLSTSEDEAGSSDSDNDESAEQDGPFPARPYAASNTGGASTQSAGPYTFVPPPAVREVDSPRARKKRRIS